MELNIKCTKQYTGTIEIDGLVIETLSQSFDEEGHMNGGIGTYITNKDIYYNNLEECRRKEDDFKKAMRDVEDESLEVTTNEDKKQ